MAKFAVFVAIGVLAHSMAASATETVTGQNGAFIPSSTYFVDDETSVIDVYILDRYQAGANFFEVRSSGSEDVNLVVVDVDFAVASPIVVSVPNTSPGSTVQSVGAVIPTGSADVIIGTINIPGDFGLAVATEIGDLVVGGDILGSITATVTGSSVRGIKVVDAGGSVLRDISAPGGRIRFIDATDLGAAGNPIAIQSFYETFQVLVSDDAYIDLDTTINGGTGYVTRIVADRLVGTIRTSELRENSFTGKGEITVVTEFDADVSILGSLVTSASEPIEINLPASGLVSQITINASNGAGAQWNAPVKVGGTTIDTPGYTDTAASLGGGAVGLAPFALHDESCAPVNGGSVGAQSSGPFSARHYGPVEFTGAGAPALVERRVTGTSWTNQTAGFTFSVTGSGKWFLTGTPVSGYEYQNGYEYRVTPVRTGSDKLFCSGVSGVPPVAAYT